MGGQDIGTHPEQSPGSQKQGVFIITESKMNGEKGGC